MRIWRKSPNPVVRRLLELGCSAEQVQRHVARGKMPAPIVRPRPRSGGPPGGLK
jgi:hypothetical protein